MLFRASPGVTPFALRLGSALCSSKNRTFWGFKLRTAARSGVIAVPAFTSAPACKRKFHVTKVNVRPVCRNGQRRISVMILHVQVGLVSQDHLDGVGHLV